MTEVKEKETLGFQAEVKQLLKLMINSLYSNKEIFLRELISNATDAADKLRFEALDKPDLYEGDSELKIDITFDKDVKTLTIDDNGIGMNRDEIIANLGTIARSGTKEFLESLTGDKKKDSQMIGQFGVGFYSAFIVADQVTVKSRRAGTSSDDAIMWQSSGEGEYELQAIDKSTRGTEIILHLKESEEEFLDDYRLRHIVSTYSDHIGIPIRMLKRLDAGMGMGGDMPDMAEMMKQMGGDAGQADPEAMAEMMKNMQEQMATNQADKADDDTDSDTVEADKESQTDGQDSNEAEPDQTPVEPEFEVINRATALWTMAKKDITEDEYKEFYKHVSHDYQDPFAWSHNRVEGKLEYTSLLYIPAKAPFDLFDFERAHGLKLYVQRVFIMDKVDQFLPRYLRFVKGVIDSNDLPLNVSREILQGSRQVDTIKSANTKKILNLLGQIAEDESERYAEFWREFGNVLKEGVGEDFSNKDKIAGLLKFASTHNDNDLQTVSFTDYISRMKEEQKEIYYITAESYLAAKNSPHIEIFKQKGIEVLLLSDRVDEWLVSNLNEFDGKVLKSIAKGNLDLEDLDDEEVKKEKEQEKTDFEGVIKQITDVLGERVKEVRISYRLTDSPACVVADEHDMGGHLQRLMQSAGQQVPTSKPIFEVNPKHDLIRNLKDEQDDDRFKDWTEILFDQAVLAEGGQIDNPAGYVSRLNGLLMSLSR